MTFDVHFSLFISMDGVYAENRLEQFQRISMDGVYAENRLERFQYTIHYSLFLLSNILFKSANGLNFAAGALAPSSAIPLLAKASV